MKPGASDAQRMGKQQSNEHYLVFLLFVFVFPGLMDSVVRTGKEGREGKATQA